MNSHRLARLKRLAAGAALVSSTLVSAGDPPAKAPSKPNVNSPPPKPVEPIYVNSPAPQEPAVVDAGTAVKPVEQPDEPRPQPPNVNSPPRVKKPVKK